MEGEGVMEGGGSDGGTDGGEESGGAGLSFRPWAAVFVGKRSFAVLGGRSQWRAVVFVGGWGVVSWVLVIRAWGSSSSALSLVVVVAVLGVGLSLWAPRRHSWSSFAGSVRCSWLMFVGCGCRTCVGWGRSCVIDEWGGRCFVVVSLWCVVLSLRCIAPFTWLPRCPVGDVAPVFGCEKRMEDGSRYSPERKRQ